MGDARRIAVNIEYDGTDISKQLTAYAKSISVDDAIGFEADSINITLEDKPGLWTGAWLPDRGALLTVSLLSSDWASAYDTQTLPLGKFEIDEIESSGPPSEVKIKGVSIPNNAEIRSVDKTRSWEKTKLSVIVKDIADGAGLELYYDTEDDPDLNRAEQSEQSDLKFLSKLCKDAGLELKVSDKTIIIFDAQKYEQTEPVLTITKGSGTIQSYSIKSSIHNIYKACHVKYKHSKKSELIECTFAAPDKKDGMTLQVNEEVNDIAAAEKLAKKKLREKNSEEAQVSITMMGNFALLSSNTVMLANFGKFDGKYIIKKATHEIGSGYTTKIDLRKCLDGY